MTKFGVVRNGEHLRLFTTEKRAKQAVRMLKEGDQWSAKVGWLTQKQADAARYHIEPVKGKVW